MDATIKRQIIPRAYNGPWSFINNWKKSLNLPNDFVGTLVKPLSALKIMFIKGANALIEISEKSVDKMVYKR